jgi:hypothetical protein
VLLNLWYLKLCHQGFFFTRFWKRPSISRSPRGFLISCEAKFRWPEPAKSRSRWYVLDVRTVGTEHQGQWDARLEVVCVFQSLVPPVASRYAACVCFRNPAAFTAHAPDFNFKTCVYLRTLHDIRFCSLPSLISSLGLRRPFYISLLGLSSIFIV